MKKAELEFILQEGEGLKIEFKESLKNIDKEIVAFANSEGGRIFLGISDENNINGVKIDNKLKSHIQDIANNCDPAVSIKLEVFDNILIIDVSEGGDKPYKCSTGFYLRQGPNSQKMKRDEIFDFAIKNGKVKFDSQINDKFEFEKDFDKKKLDQYLKLAGIDKVIDIEDILVNLGVALKKKDILLFNNAGILFFSKNPSKFFLTSKVVCVNYQTNEKVKILDRKIFDEGIIGNIMEAIKYVNKHIDVEFVIKRLEREEIPQYPEEAIREAIVNAIMHKDYFDDSEDLVIELFRNKFSVSNPGGLVKGLDPEEFGKKSRTRNSIIASLLSRTIYVEKLGTGINRINKEIKSLGLKKALFEYNDYSFTTMFFDKRYIEETVGEDLERLGERVTERVTENQRNILKAISKNKFITTKDLAGIISISLRKIKENISKLKKKGLLKRVGPAKGGYWEILK